MYLNAADKQNLPTYKRFFNQQALYRNSMFNDFSAILSDYGIEVEEVLLKRPDIRQLMMTSIKREKSNPFDKCLAQDQLFRQNLVKLMSLDGVNKNQISYQKHLSKIESCIEANELFSEEIAVKSLPNSDLLN